MDAISSIPQHLFNYVYRSHAVFGPGEAKYESVAEEAILRAAAEQTCLDLRHVRREVDSVVPGILGAAGARPMPRGKRLYSQRV
jgi:hypothetical protein